MKMMYDFLFRELSASSETSWNNSVRFRIPSTTIRAKFASEQRLSRE